MKQLLILFFLFFGTSPAGQYYHCVDKDGVRYFSNYLKPPKQRGNFTFVESPAEVSVSEVQIISPTKTEKK